MCKFPNINLERKIRKMSKLVATGKASATSNVKINHVGEKHYDYVRLLKHNELHLKGNP